MLVHFSLVSDRPETMIIRMAAPRAFICTRSGADPTPVGPVTAALWKRWRRPLCERRHRFQGWLVTGFTEVGSASDRVQMNARDEAHLIEAR